MSQTHTINEEELEKLNKIVDLPYNEWWEEIISQEGAEMDYKIVDFQKYKNDREEPSEWVEPTDEDLINEEKYYMGNLDDETYDEYEEVQDVYDELGWSDRQKRRRTQEEEQDWYQSTSTIDWFGEDDS